MCNMRAPRVDGKLIPLLLVRCMACGTVACNRPLCQVNFRWEDNQEHQLSLTRTELLPFVLRDTNGKEHIFEAAGASSDSGEAMRRWRAKFLLRTMGPRPRPQRTLAAPPRGPVPQFRWADNMHLVGKDLNYAVPPAESAESKKVRLRDVCGSWHELDFGDGTSLGGRVLAWRAATIQNLIGGFGIVFGGSGRKLSEADQTAFEEALRACAVSQEDRLSLEEHACWVQKRLLVVIRDAYLRLELYGPNFTDYLLGLAASSKYPRVTREFEELHWDGKLNHHFTRASRREWVRELALSHLEKHVHGEHRISYIYKIWRSYCQASRDLTLPAFRKMVLRDGVLASAMEQFAM
ncbi:hypothetical protein K445DRAFT_16243 [Daldinia sp. EC12]|nr:hypothetical protein K445DRAFT_16243 [Daldinia sp. EC12]